MPSLSNRARLILFPAGFILLWLAADALLTRGMRSQHTGRLGVVRQIMQGGVGAQVVCAGSSRTYVQFNPRVITTNSGRSCFNIGLDGTLPDLQLAFLKSYLRHNNRPDYLLQGVDINMLRRSTGVYNPRQYLGWLREPELSAALRKADPQFRLYGVSPLFGILKTGSVLNSLRGIARRDSPEDHINGFLPQAKAWTDEFDGFMREHPSGIAMPMEQEGIEALRGILELCRERQIKAVLIYSPEYLESQQLTVNREEILRVFTKLSADFNVPFWDYSSHPLCREKRFFYNSQHLNAAGADLFSADVAARLKALMESNALAAFPEATAQK